MSAAGEIVGHKIKPSSKNGRRYEFNVVAGEAIASGDILYVSNISGEWWQAKKADGDLPRESTGILLFAKHAIASGAHGRGTCRGRPAPSPS
jgi:hypothetical protein